MEQTISRIGKLDAVKKQYGVDAFLITSASSVKYFSGYFFYFEYGNSPFHFLPAILGLVPGGDARLILADNESGAAQTVDTSIAVYTYQSYTYEKPADPAGESIGQVIDFIRENNLQSATIGVEANSLPFLLASRLKEKFPSIELRDCSSALTELKAVKDEQEIKSIRAAAVLSDIGQQSVLRNARQGITELELFSIVHGDIEKAVGHRVPLMADLSSGQNTNSGGGMPTNKIIQQGDLVLSDFQACLQGYWGDSCSTIVLGQPTADQKKTFQLVKDALEAGIEAIKPGIPAHAIDDLLRARIGNYPHHSGHGVGTAYHEEPRITPYNETILEAGMIIALEPAIYKETFGIRLEHLMLVTKPGCEELTQFKHQFEQ